MGQYKFETLFHRRLETREEVQERDLIDFFSGTSSLSHSDLLEPALKQRELSLRESAKTGREIDLYILRAKEMERQLLEKEMMENGLGRRKIARLLDGYGIEIPFWKIKLYESNLRKSGLLESNNKISAEGSKKIREIFGNEILIDRHILRLIMDEHEKGSYEVIESLIRILRESDIFPQGQYNLSRYLNRGESTIRGYLSRLEALGIISRNEDGCLLTDYGKQLAQTMKAHDSALRLPWNQIHSDLQELKDSRESSIRAAISRIKHEVGLRIIEDYLGDNFLKPQDGWRVIYREETGGGTFDLIYKNELKGEFAVVEQKAYSSSATLQRDSRRIATAFERHLSEFIHDVGKEPEKFLVAVPEETPLILQRLALKHEINIVSGRDMSKWMFQKGIDDTDLRLIQTPSSKMVDYMYYEQDLPYNWDERRKTILDELRRKLRK